MRFKITIEYAGTRYSGWQIQKNARTVQGEIDRAVREVTGAREFELYGSGRTDAGVHALAQVAHLDVDTSLPPDTLLRRVNDALPSDINLLHIETVRHRFHARHDAAGRSYIYQVSRRRTAFSKPFVWWVTEPLDLDRMREAAALFVGRHDFRSFSDDDPTEKSTTVQVEAVEITEKDHLLVFRIVGSHFIWKMVRRVVGVVVDVGRGGLTIRDAAGMLRAASEVPARLTAPASGLFLERVWYDETPKPRYGRSLAGGTRPFRRR
jgi:tRNA pseudouridine38-40 synthase